MRIRVVYNFSLLPRRFSAITIYPFILVSGSAIDSVTLKHELVHCEQVQRDGWLKFYISYMVYFAIGLVRFGNWMEAYYDIPYEREAFTRQETPLTSSEWERILGQ